MASRSLKRRKCVHKKDVKSAFILVVSLTLGVMMTGAIALYYLGLSWLEEIPDYSNLDKLNTATPSRIYANDGTTVLAEFQLENRTPVELSQISDYVKRGTVATEDERFYNHAGFDLYATLRATVNNLSGGSIEGGSTITMQLVRNTVISDEMQDRTFERKVREIYIALKVEELYSKDEILRMYLNTINYGSGAYGIEAAARRYFSKSAADLTLAEATVLIGIPQSPTYNNPIDNMEGCLSRRSVVLQRMVANSVITQEEADEVAAQEVVLNVSENSSGGIKAYPYFTSYVRNQLTGTNNKYGISSSDLFSGGLSVTTTLDVSAQEAMSSATWAKSNATGFTVAGVAIDPENGYIKAIEGGGDYNVSQVNMATGEGAGGRQTGSTFKVFTLIAALEAGIDPATNIDAGYEVTANGSAIHNYGNASYGTRSIGSALAVSSNTAFVRLCQSVTPAVVAKTAKKLGITADLPEVPTLTLGVATIPPLQMANAFATIANGGTYYSPECVIKITDSDGKVLVDNSAPSGTRAISAEVACSAIEAMKLVINSSEGTGTEARLSTGQVAAGKTGTSEDWLDSWFVGVTPQISAALWMGDPAENYSDSTPVYSSNVYSAFANFCNKYLADAEIESFPATEKPPFISGYSDTTNHIGGNYGYSYSYYYNTIFGRGSSNYNYYGYNYNYNYGYSGSSGNSSGSTNNRNSSSRGSADSNSSTGGSSNRSSSSTEGSQSTSGSSGTQQDSDE